ncbi:hypothetical protein ACFV4K_01175 [Nocardia sp. NPDC059764]|uniref:DUF7373 family lipoprotein n=1 Tax=Nocardia sp. NPDC059764 TaxID=3346939 RepID=UPI00364F17BE
MRIGTRRECGRKLFDRLALGIAAVAAIPSLAGCGHDVSGVAVAAEVDVRQLPVGNYPTDPLDIRTTYDRSMIIAENLATARLADNVVVGPEVDPMFGHTVLSRVLGSPSGASMVLAGAVQPVLERNHMVYGYSAAASTEARDQMIGFEVSSNFQPFGGRIAGPTATSFNVAVIQFPDEEQARTAAEEMEAADFDVSPDQNARVTLERTSAAKAHWRPGIPSLAATVAEGRYVVNVFVEMPTADLDALRSLADRVFAAQLPLLERAPGLSTVEIFRLDYDPDAMLRRTLHPTEYIDPSTDWESTHTTRGYLHHVEAPATWKPLLDANGVDRISTASSGGLLFRTPDTRSATALWTGITSFTPDSADPPAVPDTTCARTTHPDTSRPWSDLNAWNHKDKFTCTLHYHRYVAQVAGDQLLEAQQKAAAQYALLANSQSF